MLPRYLLDTHVIVRWLGDIKRLSREQARALERATQRREPLALSAITLMELAMLASAGKIEIDGGLQTIFDKLQGDPLFRVLPLTFEVASEILFLHSLRDPADRTIVATARAHRLHLVTSDQRIIESGLVPVVE